MTIIKFLSGEHVAASFITTLNGSFNPMFVSLEYLKGRYGGKV
jgi:hypothetical protein